MFDSHMHTPLCNHAVGEPELYAEEAIRQGLRGIIFTCHSPMPRALMARARMRMDQFDEYVSMVLRCQEAFKGQLEVRLGMETDWFPGFEDWIQELHQKAAFDYCLGSVHWHAPEYMDAFETGTRERFRQGYFEHLAESAETGFFDCLAHPDLIKNYRCESWEFEEMKPFIAASLDRIAKTGVHMELNTSGVHKFYGEMNPSNDMLSMMLERNIPIVVGSDSHKPGRVAEGFVTALTNLKAVGYTQVSVFEKRKPKAVGIDEALSSLMDWQSCATA
jgi:histidinol-phosphatase (PHP family)